MAQAGEKKYALSCEILSHSADVRAVCSVRLREAIRDHVVTASRDGTACVWRPDPSSPNQYLLQKVIRRHTGYVSALCVIPPDISCGRDRPLLATGGQDSTILVHSLVDDIEEPLERYTGHTALITCLIYQHGQLVSGSWDGNVRVWKNMTQSTAIEAHKPAVWTVAGLFQHDGTRRFLSGGADRRVKLWEVDTKLCLQEYSGHNDVVRDIKIVSRQMFLSAANDSVIRRWNIHSGQCLNELHGHQAYVYSLCLIPGHSGEEFVSCGEDGTMRVWRGTSCAQVIHLPATSVWCVCCLENEDIVVGSSDGVARVYTANTERIAAADVISGFESKLEEHRSKSKKSDIDVSSLPGVEALSMPGRKAGQTLMINNEGVAEVYQWSAVTEEWEKIGDAIGQAPQSNIYQGQEYDYVFDIDLDEGSPTMRKLKLPYNKDTDPYVAAMDFLQANDLPDMYLDQVAEFIVRNAGEYHGPYQAGPADPFTGGARYVPGSGGGSTHRDSTTSAHDPFTGGSRYRPSGSGQGGAGTGLSGIGGAADPLTGRGAYRPYESSQPQPEQPTVTVNFKGLPNPFFPMSEFKTFSSPSDYGEKVISKIREFNNSVDETRKLKEDQLMRLQALCSTLTSPTSSTAPVSTADLQLVQTLLKWPTEYVFPGLDVLRLALLNESGCRYFVGDEDSGKVFLGELLAFAFGSQAQPKNQLLVLRCLANIFALENGQQLMDYERKWVLTQLETLFTLTSKNHQVALSTLLLNYCTLYHKTKDRAAITDCAWTAAQVLKTSFDSQAKLRTLIGIGSLALVEKDLVVSSVMPDSLQSLVEPLCSLVDTPQVVECAQHVLQAIR